MDLVNSSVRTGRPVVTPGMARVATAAALGSAWLLGSIGIALAPGLVELWRCASSRRESAAIAFAYYASLACGVICALKDGTYGHLTRLQYIGWLALACALNAVVWGALWPDRRRTTLAASAMSAGALLMGIIPGPAAFAVASPLTAAGIWLPGTGWFGLVAMLLALSLPFRRVRLSIALCSLLALVRHQPQNSTLAPITGLTTSFDVPDDPFDYYEQFRVALAAQRIVPADARLVALGEGLGGLWTETMQSAWQPTRDGLRDTKRVVLVGATLPVYRDGDTMQFDNAVVLLSSRPDVVARQRIPVPFAMWRPWDVDGTYRAHWSDAGVLELHGIRVATLLCYEQMLVLPILSSMVHRPAVVLGLSNLRAFSGHSLSRWQRAAASAWAELFNLPVIFAENR